MVSIKIGCPNCAGTGLTGTVRESICSQCTGTGMIAANDTDTLATVNAVSIAPIIVTKAVVVPPVAVKILSKGK